ncbi:MAG: hypothetical protein AAB393_09295 [Bacteroidota bacterium]
MPRPKSILQRVDVDEAKYAHNCQHSTAHRLQRGDKRLKVWDGRSPEHYCVTCALDIISRDIAELQELAERLRG